MEDWFSHFLISFGANLAFAIIFYVYFIQKRKRRKHRKWRGLCALFAIMEGHSKSASSLFALKDIGFGLSKLRRWSNCHVLNVRVGATINKIGYGTRENVGSVVGQCGKNRHNTVENKEKLININMWWLVIIFWKCLDLTKKVEWRFEVEEKQVRSSVISLSPFMYELLQC